MSLPRNLVGQAKKLLADEMELAAKGEVYKPTKKSQAEDEVPESPSARSHGPHAKKKCTS